jgi:ribosomal protein L37AE/L43A
MVKLQETSKGQKTLTLPSQLADSMDWEKGEDLEWKFHNENCLVLKQKNEKSEEDDIRCESCGSTELDQPIIGGLSCNECGWEDLDYFKKPVSNSDNKTVDERDAGE